MATVLAGWKADLVSKRAHEAFTKNTSDQVAQKAGQLRSEDQEKVFTWLDHVEAQVVQGHKNFLRLLEQLERGEQPTLQAQGAVGLRSDDPFHSLVHTLSRVQNERLEAVAALATRLRRAAAAEAGLAEVLIFIAQRLHALVSRTLEALDRVENEVEDPDLLDSLFIIDHLVTQTRRAVESLAVLGGKTARRVFKPLLLVNVMRQAVAEIEQYPRVRVQLPEKKIAVPGYAGPDIIHLLTELVENGTKFSPPQTQVLMRAVPVPAGWAIEIEDRGLQMSAEKLAHQNGVLAAPDQVDLREQLKKKQLGLVVAALLAKRHGIRVELRASLVGGTLAVVVVPSPLIMDAALEEKNFPPSAAPGATASTVPSHAAAANFHGPQLKPPIEQAPARQAGSAVVSSVSLPQGQTLPPAQEGTPVVGVAGDVEPQSGGRPPLPRRSAAGHTYQDPPTSRHQVPTGQARAGLLASYSAGVQRAQEKPATGGAPQADA